LLPVLKPHVIELYELSDENSAAFMRDVKSKLARETNRLTGWSGPVFERRYEMTVVTEEDNAQIERLVRIHGEVKKGPVRLGDMCTTSVQPIFEPMWILCV